MLISHSRLVYAATLLLATFCAHSQEPKPAPTNVANNSLLRGQLLLSPKDGVSKIALCDNSQQFAVQISAELQQQAQKVSHGQRILYIEAFGHFTITANAPVFNVTALNLLSGEINLCIRPTEESRAFGNEPSWSVTALEQELRYTQFGANEQRCRLTAQENSGAALHFQTKEADLKITQAFCNDGMSDSLFGWQATLTLAGKQKRGCARLAAPMMNASVIDSSATEAKAAPSP
ncbi:MAG: COG3650 family protein [Enterovibrio sp.]